MDDAEPPHSFDKRQTAGIMTRRLLSEIIWRARPEQIDQNLQRYGLSKRVVLMIAREAGIRVPSERFLLSSDRWVYERGYDTATPAERGKRADASIDTSLERITALQLEADLTETREREAVQAKTQAYKIAKAAAKERSIDRANAVLENVIAASKQEKNVSAAWGKAGRQPVKLALKAMLFRLLGQSQHEAVANITSRVLRGCRTINDVLLVEQARGGREIGLLTHKSVSTPRYSDQAQSGDRALGLAEWLAAAAAINAVQQSAEEAE